MRKNIFSKALLCTLTASIMIATTGCAESKNKLSVDEITTEFNNTWAKVEEFKDSVKAKNIKKTDSEHFYLIEMENGGFGYITADGKNLIGGPILQLENGKVVELGEKIKSENIKAQLKNIDLASAITLKPKTETKHKIFVFTDPTCSACAAFSNEHEKLLSNGVEINYLAWPRNPQSMPLINDVLCAKDKATAYEKALKSEKFETEKCESNVEKNIEVGKALNIKATPTILTMDGQLITGAIPADALLGALNATEPKAAEDKK